MTQTPAISVKLAGRRRPCLLGDGVCLAALVKAEAAVRVGKTGFNGGTLIPGVGVHQLPRRSAAAVEAGRRGLV